MSSDQKIGMEYTTKWKSFDNEPVSRIRWEGNKKPDDLRDTGRILVHYEENQAIHKPVMYGWYVLLNSIEDGTGMVVHILSGITANLDTDQNDELIQQLSSVMDLDNLEKSILIRMHGIVSDCYNEYGMISDQFTPEISCSLLAYLMETHRGRKRTDTWNRASATHSQVTADELGGRFNDIPIKKRNAMKKIVNFSSTTSQSELPSLRLNS